MGKYSPLGAFLRRWRRKNGNLHCVELSFAEIERIIGAMLPRGATTIEWWSNAPPDGRDFAQCQSWLAAGYEANPVAGSEVVRFHPRHGVSSRES